MHLSKHLRNKREKSSHVLLLHPQSLCCQELDTPSDLTPLLRLLVALSPFPAGEQPQLYPQFAAESLHRARLSP